MKDQAYYKSGVHAAEYRTQTDALFTRSFWGGSSDLRLFER